MIGSTLYEYLCNALAQTVGRIFSMGAAFLVFAFSARLLGVDDFGRYTYSMIFFGVLVTVAEFGTNSVIAKELAQKRDDGSVFLGNFILLRLLFSFIVMMAAIPVAGYLRHDIFSILLAGIVSLPFLGSRFFEPIFQIYGKPWFSLWLSIGYSAAYLFFSLLVFLLCPSLETVIYAYIAANIVYTVLAFVLVHKIVWPSFNYDASKIKSILRLAIPIGLSGILTLVHMRADTFMLAAMTDYKEVGLYNAAYKFLDMSVILAVMITNPLMPIFSRYAVGNIEILRQRFTKITEVITILIMPLAMITPFVAEQLLNLCFGHDYIQSAPALGIMAYIGVMTFYSMLNYTVLVALDVVAFQVWLTALSAFMNISLNLLLIPKYGFIGSAWATGFTEVLLAGVSFVYVCKSLGNIFILERWLMIGTGNILLFCFLASDIIENIYLSIVVGVTAYFICFVFTGMLPYSFATMKQVGK